MHNVALENAGIFLLSDGLFLAFIRLIKNSRVILYILDSCCDMPILWSFHSRQKFILLGLC